MHQPQAQYRRYNSFPPPPPPFSSSPSYPVGQYPYSPPGTAEMEQEEDVEYVYVRRKDPSQYGY